MPSQEKLKEFKKLEEMGLDVISISESRLEYATNAGEIDRYCDRCEYLRFLPDPDKYDWFRSGDQKAVCLALKVVIYGSLEPDEMLYLKKPLYCPMLKNKLTAEEQQEASERLMHRQEEAKSDFSLQELLKNEK